MSNHPRQMQKNIPLTPSQQIEIQTDLNLMGRQFIGSQIHTDRVPLRLSEFITESGLLQPFSDYYLYSQLQDVISRMKKDVEEQRDHSKQEKIMQYLSNQINGLMRRQLRIDGHKGTYYSILGDKDKQILNMEIRYSAFETKLRKSNQKIAILQNQIYRLRNSLKQLHNASQENVIYLQCFSQLSIMLKQNRQLVQISSLIQNKISPLIKQTQSRLADIAKNAIRDKKNRVKGVLAQYSKQLNTFYLDQNLTLQTLSQSVAAFYTNLQHINEDNWIQQRIRISSQYQNLRNHQQSLISLLSKNIDQILLQNPSLKSLKQFKQFAKMIEGQQKNGLQTMIVNGWISVGRVDGRTIQVPVQDVRTKQVINILGIQMKRLLTKYPQIKSQLSGNLLQFLSLQILQDTVGVDALDRLKQIVVYHSDVLKVQNVYNYSNKDDKDLIFHLRVLIKSLLQQLQSMRAKYNATISLDQGIIGLINQQVLGDVDISAILSLYRPQAKVVQVQRIVDRPVYIMDQLKHGVPIRTQKGVYGSKVYQKPIIIQKSVPFQMQKPIIDTVKQFVQVKTLNQVPVSIPTGVQKIVQRLMIDEKVVQVTTQKPVAFRQQIKQIIKSQVEKVVKQQQIIQKQVPVQLWKQTIKQIQKYTDKPVYLYKQSQRAVQVPVLKQYCHPKPVYIEIQKKIPYQIRTHQVKQLVKQVPKIIMQTTQIVKPVTQIQQKIIHVNVQAQPTIIQVPVNVQKQIIRQIQKQVFVQMTHFVKGDKQQIIKQVQVFVDKPLVHQVIVPKDLQIQKVVPLYIKQQKPVYVDLKVPFYKPEVKPVDLVVEKPVFLKQQIIKQINVQVPVPVIIQKQVVKVSQCVRQKIVQKIVQVPRVQIVQKIVQKVVVVPRIVQKIVQIPQIIEKCVVIQRPILQVVQIPRQITIQKIVQVPKIVQVARQVLVDNPVYKQVQVQVPVQTIVQRQVPVQIQIQKRIPHQVIKQIPQDIFRDRIVQKIIQINQVQVKDRQIQIPIIVQQKVPIIQQKAVLHQKVVQNVVKVPQIIQKIVPTVKTIQKQVVVQVKQQVPIDRQIVVQVPGQTIIQYQKQFVDVQLVQQKVIQVKVTQQVPRQVYLQVQKIIPLTIQKIVQVPQIRYLNKPQLIQVSHPVHHIDYKQVPIVVQSTRHIPTRTILQQIRSIQVQVQKTVSVTIQKQKILQRVQKIKQWCTQQVPKDLVQNVLLHQSPNIQVRQIQVQKLIQPLKDKIIQIQQSQKSLEKVVQKIVMLPQIVQVVKTIHQVAQVQAIGIAKDVQVQVHTKQYVGLTKQLRGQIAALLASFKSKVRNQPDLRILIDSMQKYLLILDKWIKFPKIIQNIKEVQVLVEKDRPVLIPTQDTNKQVALMAIIQQLVSGIRKFRKEDIKQNLNQDMLKIFFMDFDLQLTDVSLQNKYAQYIIQMRQKYQSFGNWAQNHALLLNSFLQSRFSMTNIIDQSSRANRQNRDKIIQLQKKIDQLSMANMINGFAKEKAANDYATLVKSLMSISTNYQFLDSIISNHASILSPQEYFNQSSKQSVIKINQSSYQHSQSYNVTHSIISERGSEQLNALISEKQKQISSIIVRLSNAEHQKFEMERIRSQLQRQNDNLRYDLQLLRQRLQGDASKSVTNIQQIQTRINQDWQKRINNLQQNYQKQTERLRSQIKSQLAEGSTNNQLLNENRKLSDQCRKITRQYDNYKRSQQTLKQNLQNQKKRITDEYENKIRNIVQTNQRQRKRQIQNIRRSTDSSHQNLQLERDRLKEKYQRQMKILRQDFEKAKSTTTTVRKQTTSEHNTQVRKLKDQIRKLQIQLDTSKRQIQAYQKSRLGQTTYTSGFKQSAVQQYQSPKQRYDPYRSAVQYKSPQSGGEQGSLQGSRISRESRHSRRVQQQIHSSSSRVSGRSSGSITGFKNSMTMKQLMDVSSQEKANICTLVMIKIIERIEEQAGRGIINCYTPSNIYLSNFNPNNIDALVVRFGAPITNKKGKVDGLYIPPEMHRGENINIKAVVFSLGVVWDELIHSQIYYKTIGQIENLSHEFKVRDTKLNPILKNTLFEMMSKDSEKRLQLNQVKRRLSLQKYITSETGGKVVVTSSRVSEQTKKP